MPLSPLFDGVFMCLYVCVCVCVLENSQTPEHQRFVFAMPACFLFFYLGPLFCQRGFMRIKVDSLTAVSFHAQARTYTLTKEIALGALKWPKHC